MNEKIDTAFNLWCKLSSYAAQFGNNLPPRGDAELLRMSGEFLVAASILSSNEQYELQQMMHHQGIPFSLYHYEEKALRDFPWWNPVPRTVA